MRLTVGTTETRISWWHTVGANSRSHARSRTCGESWVGAEHTNTRTKLGATERHHVLADVAGNNLSVLWVGVCQDVLNQIVPVLVASNVDEWNAWAIWATFADTVQVAAEELHSTDLETLLNYLGSELIHAILRSVSDDMVDGAAAISWSTMLADVLDAPVSELTMSNDIDAAKDFLNAWTLLKVSSCRNYQ